MMKRLATKKRPKRKPQRWLLLITFIVCGITGIGLHMAGYVSNHSVWHNLAVAHVIGSIAWLIATIIHIKRHRVWYRQLFTMGVGRKSKMTIFLTIVFLFIVITGIILLVGVDGANSPVGIWHYKIGLLLTVISIIHIWGRRKCFPHTFKIISSHKSAQTFH